MEAANGEVTSLRAEVDTLRQKVSEQEQPAPPPPPKEEEKPARRSRREREGAPVQVGQILFNGGAISQEQLDYILGEQRKFPQRSQSSIVLENGMASEEVVAQAIASQRQVLFVHLDDDSVDPTATAMLKGRIARNHSCIPVRATEQSLVLAMVDPLDLMAIQDVEQASGRQVQPVVAMASEIATAIEKHYSESEA